MNPTWIVISVSLLTSLTAVASERPASKVPESTSLAVNKPMNGANMADTVRRLDLTQAPSFGKSVNCMIGK